MNLSAILKMLGIRVSEEDLEKLQALLPQIPGIVNNVINHINAVTTNFDGRIKNLESYVVLLDRKLDLILGALRNEQPNTGSNRTNGPDHGTEQSGTTH